MSKLDTVIKHSKLDKVIKHPLYAQLTDRQRVFVLEYIKTQDGPESLKIAGYSNKAPKALLSKMWKHVILKQLLSIGLGYPATAGILTKKEVLLYLSDAIRKSKSITATHRLVTLFSELQHWLGGTGIPDITDIVRELEKDKQNARCVDGQEARKEDQSH